MQQAHSLRAALLVVSRDPVFWSPKVWEKVALAKVMLLPEARAKVTPHSSLNTGGLAMAKVPRVVAVVMMISLGSIVGTDNFGLDQVPAAVPHGPDYNNTHELGLALYTDYIWPFEIAAVILLVAIIAAIALTLRETRQTKAPRPERQVAVRSADRVRLVKVDSEPQD